MTLTALRPDGTILDARRLSDPRQVADFDQLRHPIATDQKVIPVKSYSRRDRAGLTTAHFRLRSPARTIPWPDDVAFDCEYGRDGRLAPESAWHLEGKAFVAGRLAAEAADIPGAEVLLEHRVEIEPGRWRIADVALLIDGTIRETHEIQLAVLPLADIDGRTNDYAYIGAACYWWIGREAADSSTIRGHLREQFGGFYELLAAPDDDIREPSRTQPARVTPARSKGKGQAA